MKLLSLFLLVAGWMLALAAVALFTGNAWRASFVITGVVIEVLGLMLLARSHTNSQREQEYRR